MNLHHILERQQAILADLETQVAVYESSDLFTENIKLKSQIAQLTVNNEELANRVKSLYSQNKHLTEALHASADRERGHFIDKSKDRLWIYFGQALGREADNLTALEATIMLRTNQLLDNLRRHNIDMSHPLYARIQSFQQESRQVIGEAQTKAAQPILTAADNDAYNKLQSEPLTRDQITVLAKKHSMERFVGLNLISTIGIILIIIAAIFFGQFAVGS